MKLIENTLIEPYKEFIAEPTLLDKQKNPVFQLFQPPEKPRKVREPVLIHFVEEGVLAGHPIVIQKLKALLEADDEVRWQTTIKPEFGLRYTITNPCIS